MAPERTGWVQNERHDGLLITAGLDGWIIIPADERPAIDRCPCCARIFPTLCSAQIVADRDYPVRQLAPA